jgi:hypothetical protein
MRGEHTLPARPSVPLGRQPAEGVPDAAGGLRPGR